VIDTIRDILETKIQGNVDIERAHRMGPKRDKGSRIIVARLSRQDDVDYILEKTRPPKGTVFNKLAIRVTPQLPNDLRHARAKMHYLADEFRSANNRVKIKVYEDKFTVDGTTRRDKVTPPTTGQILEIDQAEMSQLRDYKFICSDEKMVKGSSFRIYIHPARSIEDVRTAYKAILAIPEAAKCTHVISAYNLQGTGKGYQDDGDFGFGQQMLRTMIDKGQDGYVFFLTRQYGGTHLGRKRFQIVHELIKQAIERVTIIGAPTASPPKATLPIATGDDQDDQESEMDMGLGATAGAMGRISTKGRLRGKIQTARK
jgi:hypothetical protein